MAYVALSPFAGFSLGAVSSADLAFQVAGIKQKAKAAADAVVDSLFFAGGSKEWRTRFLEQVNTLVDAAMGKRADGRFNFEVDPVYVSKIVAFVDKESAEARSEYGLSASVMRVFQDVATDARALTDSIAAAILATSPPVVRGTTLTAVRGDSLADQILSGKITLKRGAKGPAIEEFQLGLRKVGFTLKVDADFGPETERVTKEYQRAKKIPVTGVIDAVTLRTLRSDIAQNVKIVQGASASASAGAATKAPPPVVATTTPPPPPPLPDTSVSTMSTSSKSGIPPVAIVGGVLAVAGVAAFLFLRKKG